MKCLIIATLCHDIDHFGLTNNFLQVTNHILAQIDNKSPLEAHHFDVAQHLLKVRVQFPLILIFSFFLLYRSIKFFLK